MRQTYISLVALVFLATSLARAQEPVPRRFDPLAKNERFRLVGVLGLPELRASYTPMSAYSTDGKFALFAEDLSSGRDDKLDLKARLLLYELDTKTWPREFDVVGRSLGELSLHADGKTALLSGFTITRKKRKDEKGKTIPETAYLSLFDLHAGKMIHTFLTKEDYIHAIALSPDGTVALAGSANKLQRYDFKDASSRTIYDEKNIRPAVSLAFLPDGKRVLAGYRLDLVGGMPAILRWDLKKAKSFAYKSVGDIYHLAVSRDGKRFASGGIQGTLSLWETGTDKVINTLEAEKKDVEQFIEAVALADDGKTVLSVWSKLLPPADDYDCSRLVAWDGEANKILWSHPVSYRGRVPMLVQGDKLLVGGGPNLFEVWSIKDGKKLQSWGGHRSPVHAVAVLPNGDILSGGNEGQVMTWRKGEIVNKRDAHVGPISVLAVAANKKQWLSAGADKTIKVWAVGEDKPVHVVKGHTGPVTSLAIAGNGRWAASASADRTVKTWDLTTGKEIADLTGHADGVNAVAISPDGSWLASASDDATIRLWPVKLGKLDPDREPITVDDHKKAVTCLAFSPDGKTLLSGSQDQTLIAWDWAKGKAIRTLPGHKNWVTSLLFVDANTVLTTSDDLSMCWWNIETGQEIGRVDFGVVGDCPRCLALVGSDRLLVGSSSWLIYEMQMLPAKTR